MPNHVTNILILTGEADAVAKMLQEIRSDNKEDGFNYIDFNTFAPMPEELRGTTSPARIVSEEDLAQWYKDKEKHGAAKPYMYESRPITAKEQRELIAKYGIDNWYDWSTENWGTKWGAYDTHLTGDNTITFDTAWSTPVRAMILLSQKYPDINMEVMFADENFGYNVGKYSLIAGQLIGEEIPKGGSDEAYELAVEIKGSENIEYYLEEELEDINEVFLRLAVKHNIIGNSTAAVLERQREIAIEVENYELAKQLTDKLAGVET